jgi:hypothetical protein
MVQVSSVVAMFQGIDVCYDFVAANVTNSTIFG